jgi:transcriptional regulator with XRE-family HTH domain
MSLPIEKLAEKLLQRFPSASVTLHRPKRAGKMWWMDLALGPTQAEVEWTPTGGFGISVNSDSVFGAQSDEVYPSVDAVSARLTELLESGRQTEDSSQRFVRAVREGRKLTQAQLAKLLRVKQASVSRLENRVDFHISTLRNIVSRLGGDLEIRATFPDGSLHILKYADETSASSSLAHLKPASNAGARSRSGKSRTNAKRIVDRGRRR